MKLSLALLAAVTLSKVTSAIPLAESTPPVQSLAKRIPASIYAAGQFEVTARGTPIQVLDNGVLGAFQLDSNFVVYVNGVPKWNSQVSMPAGCISNTCILAFQKDGNLVSYFNGVPTWATNTGAGIGAWLVFFDVEPYIVIYNAEYYPVWHTPITPPAAVPAPAQQGHGGCAKYDADGDLCALGPDNMPGYPVLQF